MTPLDLNELQGIGGEVHVLDVVGQVVVRYVDQGGIELAMAGTRFVVVLLHGGAMRRTAQKVDLELVHLGVGEVEVQGA